MEDNKSSQILRAPFPWFGGKRRVAHVVWERFGEVKNYVEPFAGSLAVLLGRPHAPKIETVNDLDCYIANFWRALRASPEAVARHADHPVNEADLHARHQWLVDRERFRERMKTEPDFHDVRIAGWWVWGLSAWIGSAWCQPRRPSRKMPTSCRKGVHRTRPMLKGHGSGTQSLARRDALAEYFRALATRLRRVRVCCGDWRRVLGPSNVGGGPTGVFLDPPYSAEACRDPSLYACDSLEVAHQVRQWAIEHGDNPLLRIAVCGYEGEHKFPRRWQCVPWKARGGYANTGQGRGAQNAHRERIWFSPHCLRNQA